MSVMAEESAGATVIRPFMIGISEAVIETLSARVAATGALRRFHTLIGETSTERHTEDLRRLADLLTFIRA